MLRFDDHLVHVKCDAKNRVIARETAIPAIVDAFVGKIERSEQAHCPSKILQRQCARSSRHRFELLVGFRRNQALEPFDQLRFLQGQIIQRFNKRHRCNFVRTTTFANANRRWQSCTKNAASVLPDGALAKGILDPLEREINPGANHAKVVLWPVHKIPTEITDPANVRSKTNFHAATDLADCPRLGAGLLSANDSVVYDNVRLFAATKDSSATAKNVRRESRALDRVAQRQRAYHR